MQKEKRFRGIDWIIKNLSMIGPDSFIFLLSSISLGDYFLILKDDSFFSSKQHQQWRCIATIIEEGTLFWIHRFDDGIEIEIEEKKSFHNSLSIG